jgi:hypothetical protein
MCLLGKLQVRQDLVLKAANRSLAIFYQPIPVNSSLKSLHSLAISPQVVTLLSRIQLKLKLVIPNSNYTIEKLTLSLITNNPNLALSRSIKTSSSPLRLEVSIMLQHSIQDHLQADMDEQECELNLVRELTLSCYGVNYNINILLHLNKQNVFNDGAGDLRSKNL